jgi:hypothetical protein
MHVAAGWAAPGVNQHSCSIHLPHAHTQYACCLLNSDCVGVLVGLDENLKLFPALERLWLCQPNKSHLGSGSSSSSGSSTSAQSCGTALAEHAYAATSCSYSLLSAAQAPEATACRCSRAEGCNHMHVLAHLVECVAGIADELTEEHLSVAVQTVHNHVHEAIDLSLIRKRLLLGRHGGCASQG